MGVSAKTYIKNIGKSVGYATIDIVKDMMPASKDFIDTNKELFKDIHDATKNYKDTINKMTKSVSNNKFYKAADYGIKNLFEDIYTGNLYNKKREDEVMNNAYGIDFSDDFNFDDDDFNFDDLSDSDKYFGSMLDDVGEKSSAAVSKAIAKSSDSVIKNERASTAILRNQNNQMMGIMTNGFSSIAENTGKMVSFASTVMQTHAENTKTFYENTTDLMTKQNELLQKIAENTTINKKENKYYESNGRYSDISSGGIVDFRKYAKAVQGNLKNGTGLVSSIGSMLDEDMLMAMAANPGKLLLNAGMKAVIPKMVKKSANNLNDSLSNIFGSLISKVNSKKDDYNSNSVIQILSNIFGIDSSVKRNINTSNYEKGPIQFNGKAQMALTNVIPTYLARIEAAITGKKASLFDFDQGKFIDVQKIIENSNNRYENSVNYATYDMKNEFKDNMRYMKFSNDDDQKTLEKDIDNFFKAVYKKGYVNPYKINDYDYSEYGVSNKTNFSLIKEMFLKSPQAMQMAINSKILSEKDSLNKSIRNMEMDGTSIENRLYDNSFDIKHDYSTEKKSIKNDNSSFMIQAMDAKGHNVYYYLENMLAELMTIRKYGSSSPTNGKKYSKNIVREEVPDDSIKDNKVDNKYKNTFYSKNSKTLAYDDLYDFDFDDAKSTENYVKNIYDIKNEKDLKSGKKPQNKTLLRKLNEAQNPKDYKDAIGSSIANLINAPATFITKSMDSMNKTLYNIVYDKPIKTDDGVEVNGFLELLIHKTKQSFKKLTDFLNDAVIDPVKTKVKDLFKDFKEFIWDKFGIGDKLKSVKGKLFGTKDEKGEYTQKGVFSDIIDATKDSFKQAFAFSKNAVKEFIQPIKNSVGSYVTEALDKYYDKKTDRKAANMRVDSYNNNNNYYKDTNDFATSDGVLERMGVNKFNSSTPNDMSFIKSYSELRKNKKNKKTQSATDKFNNKKYKDFVKENNEREESEKLSSLDNNYESPFFDKIIGGMAKGGFVPKTGIYALSKGEKVIPTTNNKNEEVLNEDNAKLKFILDGMPGYAYGTESLKNSKMKINGRAMNGETGHDFLTMIIDQLQGAVQKTAKSLFNKDLKSKDSSQTVQNILTDVKKNIPSTIGNGIVGAVGLSVLTGMSPLLGGAIGAGVSLVRNSKSVREFLFGAEDENGNVTKEGMLPKGVSSFISKYGKDLTKLGIGGGITGLLLGHPYIGMALGSGMALVKNSDTIREKIFGDMGLLNPKRMSKLKKAIPGATVGALAMMLKGPFPGILPNAVLGAGLGIIGSGEKAKKVIFGSYNERTHEYEGGILPTLRHVLVDPAKKFMDGLGTKIKNFVVNQIKKPLEYVFAPIKALGQNLSDKVKNFFDKSKDDNFFKMAIGGGIVGLITGNPLLGASIGSGISIIKESQLGKNLASYIKGYIDKINVKLPFLEKAGRGIKKFASTALNPLTYISAPFKYVGKEMAKNGMIKNLGASEIKRLYGDIDYKGKDVNEAISNLSKEDMQKLITNTQSLITNNKDAINNEGKSKDNLTSEVSRYVKGVNNNKRARELLLNEKVDHPETQNKLDRILYDDFDTELTHRVANNKSQMGSIEEKISVIVGTRNPKEIKEIVTGFTRYSSWDTYISALTGNGIKLSAKEEKQIKDLYYKYRDLSDKTTSYSNKDNKDKLWSDVKNGKFEGYDYNGQMNKLLELGRTYQTNAGRKEAYDSSKSEIDKMIGDTSGMNPRELIRVLENEMKTKDKNNLWTEEQLKTSDDKEQEVAIKQNIKAPNHDLYDKFDTIINTVQSINSALRGYDDTNNVLTDSKGNVKSANINQIDPVTGNVLGKGKKIKIKVKNKASDAIINKPDEDNKEKIIQDGKVLIADAQGNLKPDATDKLTKEKLKDELEEKSFMSKVKEKFTSITEFFTGKDERGKPKKESFFSKFAQFAGGTKSKIGDFLKKGALIVGAMTILPHILPVVLPVVQSLFSNVLAPLATNVIIPGIKNILVPLFSEVLLPFLAEVIPSAAKASAAGFKGLLTGKTTEITDDMTPEQKSNAAMQNANASIAKSVGLSGKDGESSLGGNMVKSAVRGVIAGPKALRLIPVAGKLMKMGNNGLKNASKNIILGYGRDAAEEAAEKAAKNAAENAAERAANKVIENTAEKGVKEATEKGVKGWAIKSVKALFNNKTIQKAIKKAGKEVNESMIQKLAKECGEKLAKSGVKTLAKASIKIAALLSSGGLINVAFALVDFASGCMEARSILGITEKPTFLQGILAGLIKAANGFVLLGLIPESWIVSVFVDALGWGGDDIKGKRDDAKNEVEYYNKKYGTDLSIEQYNTKVLKKTTLGGHIGNLLDGKSYDKLSDSERKTAQSGNWKEQAASGSFSDFFKNMFSSKNKEEAKNVINAKNTTNNNRTSSGKHINPLLPQISQLDYKNAKFNTKADTVKQTIATDGCGPVSATMVVNGLYGDNKVDVNDAAQFALSNGFKKSNEGVSATYFKSYLKKNGIDTSYYDGGKSNAALKTNVIKDLKENKPVILMGQDVDASGKTPFGPNNHYVVATGLSGDNKNIILNNPESKFGGEAFNVNDLLSKTKLAIKATLKGNGLNVVLNNDGNPESAVVNPKNTITKYATQSYTTNTPTANLNKNYDPIAYQDLTKFNKVTAEQLNAYIAKVKPNSPFAGKGQLFINASNESGLDPRYVLAHAAIETGWGTSPLAKNKNNYFGIDAYNSDPYNSAKTFSTGMEAGLVEGAKWIRKNYYDKGQTNVYDMIFKNSHKYAVNDDGTPNTTWLNGIASIMRKTPNAYKNALDQMGSGSGTGFVPVEYPVNKQVYTTQSEAAKNANANDGISQQALLLQSGTVAGPVTYDDKAKTEKYVADLAKSTSSIISKDAPKLPYGSISDFLAQYLYGNNKVSLGIMDGCLTSPYMVARQKIIDAAASINNWDKTVLNNIFKSINDSAFSFRSKYTDLNSIKPFVNEEIKSPIKDVPDELFREFAYNPGIMANENKQSEFIEYMVSKAKTDDEKNAIRTKYTDAFTSLKKSLPYTLNATDTYKLYTSPSFGYNKNGDTLLAPYGSSDILQGKSQYDNLGSYLKLDSVTNAKLKESNLALLSAIKSSKDDNASLNALLSAGTPSIENASTGSDKMKGLVTQQTALSTSSGDAGTTGVTAETPITIFDLFDKLGSSLKNAMNMLFGLGTSSTSPPVAAASTIASGITTSLNSYNNQSGVSGASNKFFASTLNSKVTSSFGPRSLNGKSEFHNGIDYSGAAGSAIKSPITGTVSGNVANSSTAGNYVTIKDSLNNEHRFLHMQSKSPLAIGDKIKNGDLIGYMGNTGDVSPKPTSANPTAGTHLHYDVNDRLQKIAQSPSGAKSGYVDPNDYLNKYYSLYPNQDIGYTNNINSSGTATAMSNTLGNEQVIQLKKDYNATATGGDNSTPIKATKTEELLIKMVTYLAKISDNTGLLSNIIQLLSDYTKIDADTTISSEEKQKAKVAKRKQLVDTSKQYSSLLNSQANGTSDQALSQMLYNLASE